MNIRHNRDEVIKKGVDLFTTRGYNALGVDLICSMTGMTKGAFYNAFKSKEGFLNTCLDAYSEMNIAFIEERLYSQKEIPAKTRLLNFYEEVLKMQATLNFSGCMVNNTMAELSNANDSVKMLVHQHFEKFIQIIEPIIIEGQKENSITSDIDSKTITEIFTTTFNGLLIQQKGKEDYKSALKKMKVQ